MKHPDDWAPPREHAILSIELTPYTNLVYHMVAATRGEMTPEKAIARAIEIVAAMEAL